MESTHGLIVETQAGFEQLATLVQETADSLSVGSGVIGDIMPVVEKLDRLFQSIGQFKGMLTQDEMLQDFIALSSDTNRVLLNIMEAMASGDIVLLSDLLNYELKARIDKWINITREIGAQVN